MTINHPTPILRALGALSACAVVMLSPLVAGAQTATPPAPRASPSPPLARITSPARDQVVRGSIEIQGSATAPNFSRYEVSYQPEAKPGSWVLLSGDVQEVREGTLAIWTTRPLSDTAYSVRLQVFTRDNAVLESIVRNVTVSNTVASAAGAVAAAPAVTDTLRPAVTAPAGATISLSDFPKGFTLGVSYAAYAFLAFCAYLAAKRIVSWLWKRFGPSPSADHGD